MDERKKQDDGEDTKAARFVFTEEQLATALENIKDRIKHVKQMDLTVEDNLQQALKQSQDILAALALYRKMLARATSYYGSREPRETPSTSRDAP